MRSDTAEIGKDFLQTLHRFLARQSADHLRHHHVLSAEVLRQQPVRLINEADVVRRI